MASLVSKMRLKVSPLTGIAYITTVLKNGWSGQNRRALDDNEVFQFMIDFIDAKLDNEQSIFQITGKNNKIILNIEIYRENIK